MDETLETPRHGHFGGRGKKEEGKIRKDNSIRFLDPGGNSPQAERREHVHNRADTNNTQRG